MGTPARSVLRSVYLKVVGERPVWPLQSRTGNPDKTMNGQVSLDKSEWVDKDKLSLAMRKHRSAQHRSLKSRTGEMFYMLERWHRFTGYV